MTYVRFRTGKVVHTVKSSRPGSTCCGLVMGKKAAQVGEPVHSGKICWNCWQVDPDVRSKFPAAS